MADGKQKLITDSEKCLDLMSCDVMWVQIVTQPHSRAAAVQKGLR